MSAVCRLGNVKCINCSYNGARETAVCARSAQSIEVWIVAGFTCCPFGLDLDKDKDKDEAYFVHCVGNGEPLKIYDDLDLARKHAAAVCIKEKKNVRVYRRLSVFVPTISAREVQ